MNDLELYGGIHSHIFEKKKCPYCHKEYKFYKGTVAYKYNKLQFCSYNCREYYKKKMKELLDNQKEMKFEESERKRLESARIRSRESYQKRKLNKEKVDKVKLKELNKNTLTEREKIILKELKEGKTLQEIGDEFNITGERVRQIKTIALKKIEGEFKV